MRAYESRFEQAQTVSELARLAREIYAEDLENGYVTVLGEMVAGGVSDLELGGEVVARLQPWIEIVERELRELLAGSLFESIVPSRDLAFAIIALYLGTTCSASSKATMPAPSRCSISVFATRRSRQRCCPPNDWTSRDEPRHGA